MPNLDLPNVGKLDTLGILFALLPGLLTFLITRALTARERRIDAIEAVLWGLAYTLLVHALWAIVIVRLWIPIPDIVGLSLCAIALGLIVAKISNSGWLYALLRQWKITSETSWQTTWESSFRHALNAQWEYAVLHLKDGRRIMGAIRAYSAEQSNGHISIDQAKWLGGDDSVVSEQGLLLIPANDVNFVQFLPPKEGAVL